VITNRNVQRAECGACNHVEYIEEGQQLTTGYYISVTDYAFNPDWQDGTYVCRETHLGKAARNVTARHHNDPDGERGNEHGNGNGDQGGSQNEPPTYNFGGHLPARIDEPEPDLSDR
jgi:hypothetical protein